MKNRDLLFAIAFAATCSTGLSAMQENNQDDNSEPTTPRNQILTDQKILDDGMPSTIKPSPSEFAFSPSSAITALTVAATDYFTNDDHIADPTTRSQQ